MTTHLSKRLHELDPQPYTDFESLAREVLERFDIPENDAWVDELAFVIDKEIWDSCSEDSGPSVQNGLSEVEIHFFKESDQTLIVRRKYFENRDKSQEAEDG